MTTAIPCHVTAELPETVDERIQAAAMKRQSLEDLRHAQLTEKLGHLPSATAASDTAQATPSTYVALFQPPEHNSPASDRHEAVLQRRRDMEEHRAIALDEQMKIEESRQNHAVELRKDALEEKRNAAHASLEDKRIVDILKK
ncbi:hypothetical protein BDEG_26778 [Batrachochytrium dendrobatidis JEL423]|uniref:Uncharacterized protein n=1 Tax=Batrachochytrium dendrobatidis (strain JEL423) TaxID=403673 RepID=A0A177WU95_BATDL|nr:hypothetical protein BDEG_26778 [Batrachochytrium dendrobatidis JEL423]